MSSWSPSNGESSSTPSNDEFSSTFSDHMNKVGPGYGIAIAVGILILVSTIMLASYVCVRVYGRRRLMNPGAIADDMSMSAVVVVSSPSPPRGEATVGYTSNSTAIAVGLDEATLASYPKIIYAGKQSLASAHQRCHADPSCSICLADYRQQEVLRLLPDCAHVFHASCIDAWLRLHPSCPVCRTSPLPTPQSTPLSELVPLTHRTFQQPS